MANENKKDFNAMMNNQKDMPKIIQLEGEAIKKWGGETMIVAPAIYYDQLMKKIPFGKIITTSELRKYIAKENNVSLTCPLTAGIFINICAWASFQRENDKTPYWRTLKANGELNPRFPGGVLEQKKLLEKEGHKIIVKGKKNLHYFILNYQNKLYEI